MAENVIVRNSEGDDVVYEEVSGVELLTEDGATATFIHDAEIKQANWEQTDNTQKDYIRNKPKLAPAATEGTYASLRDKLFGDIPIVLEEAELPFEYDENFKNYISGIANPGEMIGGETYKVTWDGAEYLCLYHEGKIFEDIDIGDENTCWFGNQTLFWNLGHGEDTGEPFCIWRGSDGEGFCIETLETDATHTISIVPVNEVMKLDKKYLPDDIGGSKTELPEVTESDNGKVLGVVGGAWGKMSVSAGGTGGVSSWNDLLDKPFGEGIVTIFEGELQDELTDNDGDGINDAWTGQLFVYDTSDATLEAGKTYTVIWEGTEYELECSMLDGFPFVGNMIAVGGEDNGVPFAIVRDAKGFMDGTPCWMAMLVSIPTDLTISGAYSCKISGEGIKKIDDKYINLHQSDWEAADKDSAEFLKNKPFESVLPEGAVVTECEALYDPFDFGLMLWDQDSGVSYVNRDNVKEGASYYVKCGEYEYEGIGISSSEATALLNNGYSVPGGIKIFNSEDIHVATLFIEFMGGLFDFIVFEQDYKAQFEQGSYYPVKITCNKEFIKKLDSKYLPDGVATESWVQSYVEEYIRNLGLTSTT